MTAHPWELVLVRHGQTPCTLAGRFCGAHDPALTEVGQHMAERLATHPAVRKADRVVTSPMTRAVATAGLALAGSGRNPAVDDRLRELSFGGWENRLPREVGEAEGDALARWRGDPALHAPPNGESGLQVMARAVACVREVMGTAGSVVLVSHKAPIRLVLAYFLGIPPARYRDIGAVPVGSVSRLRLTRDRAEVLSLGDVSHLPEDWRLDPDRACPLPEGGLLPTGGRGDGSAGVTE
ncbi:histidine phosphatase family protein [Streptomyces sp. NPDC002838]|uniref:histidine phosphatase family protein n=1 Tax=Streptomyces sp. NPDC002838 TaxID=3154436 RepID=UPI0033348758